MPDTNVLVAAIAVISPVVAFGVWLLRLEGRLATHEKVCEKRQEHIAQALERIEDRQDSEHEENKETQKRQHDENTRALGRLEQTLHRLAGQR